MLKATHLAVCCVCIFFLVSCSTGKLHKISSKINNGDTKEAIIKLLGTSENRQMKGTNEAWQYCETGMMGDDYLMITLHSGKVAEVSTYQNTVGSGMCSSFFRTINWVD